MWNIKIVPQTTVCFLPPPPVCLGLCLNSRSSKVYFALVAFTHSESVPFAHCHWLTFIISSHFSKRPPSCHVALWLKWVSHSWGYTAMMPQGCFLCDGRLKLFRIYFQGELGSCGYSPASFRSTSKPYIEMLLSSTEDHWGFYKKKKKRAQGRKTEIMYYLETYKYHHIFSKRNIQKQG